MGKIIKQRHIVRNYKVYAEKKNCSRFNPIRDSDVSFQNKSTSELCRFRQFGLREIRSTLVFSLLRNFSGFLIYVFMKNLKWKKL